MGLGLGGGEGGKVHGRGAEDGSGTKEIKEQEVSEIFSNAWSFVVDCMTQNKKIRQHVVNHEYFETRCGWS